MIKNLRKKFILVTMLSTFAVLFVIIGGLNVANYISMNSGADSLLDILAENDGKFPDYFMGRRVDFEERGAAGGKRDSKNNSPRISGDDSETERPQLPPNVYGSEFITGDSGSGTQWQITIYEEEFEFPEIDKRERDFTYETPYATRFFSVKYDPCAENVYTTDVGRIASVSETEAVSYAKDVISCMKRYSVVHGYRGNYRYCVTRRENDSALVVFLDMTEEKTSFFNVLRFSLILSGVGLLAVFLLVWYFSKKVFRPVEEGYRKQKRFITDASHELKTPLSIISANVEVLEMENEESKWSGSIKNQVSRMSGLVEQMVTLSRLDESDELTMVAFDFTEAVKDTAEGYQAVAKKNDQEFEVSVEDGINMTGDEAKIRQMVGLLLDNAVKYASAPEGEEKAKIKLSAKKKGRKILLKLWNTTDQVAEGNQDILFERFYRPDASRNSKKGGSGIGLSIVKSIVEAHKGKITANSKDGKSICFEAELPLHA